MERADHTGIKSTILYLKGNGFVISTIIVLRLPNSGKSSNAQSLVAKNIGTTKVIHIGSDPTSIMDFPVVINSLVVSTDIDR